MVRTHNDMHHDGAERQLVRTRNFLITMSYQHTQIGTLPATTAVYGPNLSVYFI